MYWILTSFLEGQNAACSCVGSQNSFVLCSREDMQVYQKWFSLSKCNALRCAAAEYKRHLKTIIPFFSLSMSGDTIIYTDVHAKSVLGFSTFVTPM